MSEKGAEPKPFFGFVYEEVLKWFARGAIWAVVAVLAWLFTPLGLKAVSIWEGPDRVAEIHDTLEKVSETLTELKREVQIARAPRDVVEYGPASTFKDRCKAGVVCLLTLEIRRVSETAERCRIIPGSNKREVISVQGGHVWEAEIDGGQTRNIGGRFVLIEIRVRMPEGLDPGRYYYRQTTFYDECPWQENGRPPVLSISPLIGFEVVD